MPRFSAPTFTDLFPTFDESNARFDARLTPEQAADLDAYRKDAIQQLIMKQSEALKALLSQSDTPIEHVLNSFQLESQAALVKRKRLDAMNELLTTFGLEVVTRRRGSGQ